MVPEGVLCNLRSKRRSGRTIGCLIPTRPWADYDRDRSLNGMNLLPSLGRKRITPWVQEQPEPTDFSLGVEPG